MRWALKCAGPRQCRAACDLVKNEQCCYGLARIAVDQRRAWIVLINDRSSNAMLPHLLSTYRLITKWVPSGPKGVTIRHQYTNCG